VSRARVQICGASARRAAVQSFTFEGEKPLTSHHLRCDLLQCNAASVLRRQLSSPGQGHYRSHHCPGRCLGGEGGSFNASLVCLQHPLSTHRAALHNTASMSSTMMDRLATCTCVQRIRCAFVQCYRSLHSASCLVWRAANCEAKTTKKNEMAIQLQGIRGRPILSTLPPALVLVASASWRCP
jgi:hypothetical protein